MTVHISNKDIAAFRAHELSPERLLMIDEHMINCPDCRVMVADMPAFERAVHELEIRVGLSHQSYHLTYEQLERYADKKLVGTELAAADSHLGACEDCMSEVRQFREFAAAAQLQKEKRPAFWESIVVLFSGKQWILAACILAVTSSTAAVFIIWSRRPVAIDVTDVAVRNSQSADASNQTATDIQLPEQNTANAINSNTTQSTVPAGSELTVALNDAGRTVGLTRSGELFGYDDLAPQYKRMILDSIRNRPLTISKDLDEVRTTGKATMGEETSSGSNAFRVIGPVGKIILTSRPRLTWQALDGAKSYIVNIYDTDFNQVASSGPLKATVWQPTLQRDTTYIWQVTALKDGQEFKAPERPLPEARFNIVSNEKAREIDAIRRQHPNDELLIGLVYANAGMLEEAEKSFRLLLKSNPSSPVVQKLLAEIKTQRNRP